MSYYDFEQQLIEDFGPRIDDVVVLENREQENSYIVLTPSSDFFVYLYHEPSGTWMSLSLLEYQQEYSVA